ncbi:SemiSWEET family sugar transporter [Candidatus Omnitrophota bacterium]
MDYIIVIGMVAATCTTVAFFPQILQVYRTKHTRDLSLSTFIFLTTGIFLWIIYGVLLESLPIILANSITLIGCLYILIMKIKCG